MKENIFFPEVKGNFGFGCMRLKTSDGIVDNSEFSKMIDDFIAAGFNYFDTAHGYLSGQSELAIGECLSSRYPREKFLLTNKLTSPYFNSQEDIRPFFEKQLEACKVDYFDFYLMHAQSAGNYPKFKRCRAYETAFRLKEEGKIRHVGLSFHDSAETLDMILSENPDVEVVQIQLNYADFEDPNVQSRRVYEVCEKHLKPVIVMEPIKGGSLASLPDDAEKIFSALDGGTPASYALRFAADLPMVHMVLSGMSNYDQMKDNLITMSESKSLDAAEKDAISKVCAILGGRNLIPCTACRYCTDGCPMGISIPDLFSVFNSKKLFRSWNQDYYYSITTENSGKASDCISCGQCEDICPQHLPIRDLLKDVAEEFEK